MDSFQHSSAVDRHSSFKERCETAHRRESADTETDPAAFDYGRSAPNYIRGSLSDLCNIHCSHIREANQAYNPRPGVVKDTVDDQCLSNTFTHRVREDAHRTKRKSATKASPAKGGVTASLEPARNLIRGLSPGDHASEYGAEDAADGVAGVTGQRHIRQSQCINLEREKELVYTRGPVRIVSVSDGNDNNCAALLLNRNFSDSIKKVIEAQRKLDDEIREMQKQGEITRVLLRKLEEKLDYYHSRQVGLVRGATGASSEGFAALEKQFPEISKKIEIVENLRSEEAADEQHRQTCLQASYKDFFEAQRVVNRYLESAFVDARLMSPSAERIIDTPASSGRFEAANNPAIVPTGGLSLRYCAEAAISQISSPKRSASVQTDPVMTSPEDIAALNLYREYVRAKQRLKWAQREFDLRDETREREQYWNDRDLRRSGGTEGLPQEEFDLLWVEHLSLIHI